MTRYYFLLGLCCFLLSCKTDTEKSSSTLYSIESGKTIYNGTKSDDVVAHITSEPANLHPTVARDATHPWIISLTHQTLVRIDLRDSKLAPDLASSLPAISSDGLTHIYDIDPNARWEEDRPITAEDVLFSLKMTLSPFAPASPLESYLEYIENMEGDPENPRRVVLTFSQQYILNPYILLDIRIMDKKFYDPEGIWDDVTVAQLLENSERFKDQTDLKEWSETFWGNEYGTNINLLKSGSGPYEISEWTREQQIVLSRKDNYWGVGRPEPWHQQDPPRIFFRVNKDMTSIVLQIKAEQIDFCGRLNAAALEELQASPTATENFDILAKPNSSTAVLMFNTRPDGLQQKKLFEDAETRNAVAHLLPLEEIKNDIAGKSSSLATSVVPVSNPDFNSKLQAVDYNFQKATALFENAGWTDSDQDGILDKEINGKRENLKTTLSFPGSKSFTDLAQRVQTALKSGGIDCELDPLGTPALIDKLVNHQFDMALLSLRAPSEVLPYEFKQNWHSDGWPEGDNYTGYSDSKLDELIDLARVSFDMEERKKYVDEIQQILMDQKPFIPLFTSSSRMAMHKRFNYTGLYGTSPHVYINDLEVIRAAEN